MRPHCPLHWLKPKRMMPMLRQPAMEESWNSNWLEWQWQNADPSIICVSPYDRIYLICTCWIADWCLQVSQKQVLRNRNIHQAYRIGCHCAASIYRSKGILNVCLCQPSRCFSFNWMKKKKTTAKKKLKRLRKRFVFV